MYHRDVLRVLFHNLDRRLGGEVQVDQRYLRQPC
jgi:hypothetical protein